jgi:hypothetical protein
VAGQVLDISKHENVVHPERRQSPVLQPASAQHRTARVYSFPSPTPQPAAAASIAATQPNAALAPQATKQTWRARLAIELAIGFMVWLIWFWWHMLH